MLINFFFTLRKYKLPVTIRELMDLLQGLKSQLVYANLDDFYLLSRTALVKDEKNYDKFFLSLNKNINFLGPQKKLDKFIKGSICGLANLRIATGIQGKVLTYMSYGLPVVCSKKVAVNFSNSVLTYNNNEELVSKLGILKNNYNISNKLRINSKKLIKNFSKEKINRSYLKIIKI